MATTKVDRLLELVREKGILRARDLDAHDIPRAYLSRLAEKGLLESPSRGIYISAGAEPHEHQSLIETCTRVPGGVVCLLSALQFHDLTTEAPFEVWLAIDRKARAPTPGNPPLRIVRFSRRALTDGIEEHAVGGATVRVTDVTHTVADCFKYRTTVGLDVALEALRDSLHRKRATVDELHRAARSRRMANVIRPYLEALA